VTLTGDSASGGRPGLARRLGTADAVMIGLGSMIGAGVFAVFTPAAAVAGAGLLLGLGIAAVVAYCNATASAQLAAAYPTSGATYVYGRERLGAWWGFVAGRRFVIGKTASCAAMALTFWLRPDRDFGEEVRDPARTIPRAIVIALLGAVALYTVDIGRTGVHRPGGQNLQQNQAEGIHIAGCGRWFAPNLLR
jgi:amino acid transporter